MAQNDAIKAHDKQLQALDLRKAGISYQKIADALGYANAMGAWKAVNSALKRTLSEPAEDVRRLEIERLDALLFALYASAVKGSQGAVDRCLRIMERRAKLLGLDAPTKTDVTTDGEPLNAKGLDDERFDRSISTLVNALREIVPGADNKQDGKLDTTK